MNRAKIIDILEQLLIEHSDVFGERFEEPDQNGGPFLTVDGPIALGAMADDLIEALDTVESQHD